MFSEDIKSNSHLSKIHWYRGKFINLGNYELIFKLPEFSDTIIFGIHS